MKKWFQHPLAYMAILIAAVCGVLFVGAAVPGFSKLPTGTQNLRVVILDQDRSTASQQVTRHLRDNLPFKVTTTTTSLTHAKHQLNARQVALIIRIKAGFATAVTRGQAPKLTYIENQSNGLLHNMVTKNVTTQVTTQVAQQLTTVKTTQALAKTAGAQLAKQHQTAAQAQAKQLMQAAIAKQPTIAQHPQQLKALQQRVKRQVQAKFQAQLMPQVKKQATAAAQNLTGHVTVTTTKLHHLPSNYQYQFAPMFLNLGAYLGLMLMSLVLSLLFMSARHVLGKWSALLAAQLNGLLGVLIAPLFTVGVLRCLIQFSGTTFWHLLGAQLLFGCATFEFTFALALLAGGLPSMLLQLPLLVSQVLASGAIIPRPALNSFYRWLSEHTPMSQGVYLTFNALYGGGAHGYANALWWLIGLSLVVTAGIVSLGYRSTKPGRLAVLIGFTA
ncbi:ABC transporter permease [Levilactobacillus acidifarinae]|uniref:ABC-2 type transporter transmembrane domain-containing protein n=1 Tax=Levilactobacillus acidifarinae DSM 19394 = JCM 15949 TaxID=1423715 RepID=A0A0R1LQM0_9LACO|nr:ABC transporter permease [Levilactobacillus acidifarinae]KRK94538.1 hypothetical protein FD25_GL000506 [Levilactobacillus acidifarinae DSM 19394]GEO68287.1 hypothetical protein LAC03_01970 [Levilactobacillus acidifarinae]